MALFDHYAIMAALGHNLDRNLALPSAQLARAAEIVCSQGLHREFLGVFASDITNLTRSPVALGFIAKSAEKAGDHELAENARSVIDKAYSEQLVACEHAGDWSAFAALLSQWADQLPVGSHRLRQALLLAQTRKDTQILDKLIEASIRSRLMTPNEYVDAANDLVAIGEDERAFRLAKAGIQSYPNNPRLLELLTHIGSRVGEIEVARQSRARRLLLEEVDHNLIEDAGPELLMHAGGREFLHNAIVEAASDPSSTDGLISVAELCMMSLRRLTALRSGQHREAEELAPYGAANWKADIGRANRLAGFIRVLCTQAIKLTPNNLRPLCLLLELGIMFPTSRNLTSALCRSLVEQSEEIPANLSNLIWRAALDFNDPELRDFLRASMPSKETIFHPFVDAQDAIQSRGDTRLRAEAKLHKQPIKVVGNAVNSTVDVSIRTARDFLCGPMPATIHCGYLVGLEDSSILQVMGGWNIIQRRDALQQYGFAGALLEACTEIVTIEQPILFVPGIRVQYNNYFHFLGQIYPRLIAVWKGYGDDDLCIAIPDFAPAFVSEILRIGGISQDRIVPIPSDRRVDARRLITMNPTAHDWQCSPEDLVTARKSLRAPGSECNGHRRVFLSRPLRSVNSRGRDLLNEDQLAKLAEDKGYEIIDAGSLGVKRQQELFSQCSVICGPTGAALTNTLFLPDNARVICLSPQETCRTYYPGLTLGSSVEFTWVLGSFEPDAVASVRFPHLPYTVPTALLEEAL